MHPSQTIFSGEVSKKEARFSLSFWSLFLSAARTEHTLQYMPHGDKYSFFTPILSPPILSAKDAVNLWFAFNTCVERAQKSVIKNRNENSTQATPIRGIQSSELPVENVCVH